MPGLDTVEVCVDLERFRHPFLMGRLHHQLSAAGEIFSFEYDRAWLEQLEVFSFDPDLALATGHQYPAAERKNFGIFLDSTPDRLGQRADAAP
jgi:serine/threonine-protein kinase HipA